MGKSVLSFPEASTPLSGANIIYLLQGSGLDRDRKVTLENLRQYFTGQGNEFMTVATADAVNVGTITTPHWILTKDITSTANVILIVQGNGATPFELNLIGSIPVGCKLTIINWNPALASLTSNKAMVGGGTMHNLDWAEFIWSADNRWYAIVLPSRGSVSAEISQAVSVEQMRASTEEAELATQIGNEATNRYNADYGLGLDLEQEANNRADADILLGQRIDNITGTALEDNFEWVTIPTNPTTGAYFELGQLTLSPGKWLWDAGMTFEGDPGAYTRSSQLILRNETASANLKVEAMASFTFSAIPGNRFTKATGRRIIILAEEAVVTLNYADDQSNGLVKVFGNFLASKV